MNGASSGAKKEYCLGFLLQHLGEKTVAGVGTLGHSSNLPPRPCRFFILNRPHAPQLCDGQLLFHGSRQGPETLGRVTVKPHRWFWVRMADTALA